MTAADRARQLVTELRAELEYSGTGPKAIVEVIGALLHDLANAQQSALNLEYMLRDRTEERDAARGLAEIRARAIRGLEAQLADLRASVVEAMSVAGPSDEERTG